MRTRHKIPSPSGRGQGEGNTSVGTFSLIPTFSQREKEFCTTSRIFVLVFAFALAGSAWGAITSPLPPSLKTAQQLFDTQRYNEAIDTLPNSEIQKLREEYLPQAYTILGLSYQHVGQLDKALGIFQLAVGLFPKNINLTSCLADLLHAVELDDRARPLYEHILKIHPNNAGAHLGLAEIEESQGNLDESVTHYELCLKEWKDNAAVWRAYGEVLAERRDYKKAADAIKKSLSLEPNNVDSLRALASFQFQQGFKAEAFKTVQRAINLAPIRDDLQLQYSLWLLEEGVLDQSLSQAEHVLQKKPKNPLGLWIRASIELRQGKTEDARQDLQTAAAQSREAPFVAQVATAMLLKMDWGQ